MASGFAESLGIRLRRAYQSLHRRANAELRRQFGVTADQFVVLSLLAERDGVSQQELCNRCYSDPSTMGALVRLMERRGWVSRDPDPQDLRTRSVRLTRDGRLLQQRLWEAADTSFHRDLWGVPRNAQEEHSLFDALDRIVLAMERTGGLRARAVAPYRLSVVADDDPYPYYRRLRDDDPAHCSEPENIWVLTRYKDVSDAFRDWRTWSSARRGNLLHDMPERIGRTLGTTDPPDHRFARSLVEKAFFRSAIGRLSPRIAALAGELAETARERGWSELVADVSAPFNAAILGAMFGVPDQDFLSLRRWLDDFFLREDKPEDGESRQAVAMKRLREYLDSLARERIARPSEDLMSKMLSAEERGRKLDLDQVVVTTMTFLTAGFESTNNLFTNLAYALARHPAVYRQLKQDTALIPSFVEEGMRWDAAAQGLVRSPNRDVTLHGKTIPEGAQVLLHIGAANRDERTFPQPDRFDVNREGKRHLGLGKGIHFCIGAPLAREMAQALFAAMVKASRVWEIDLRGARRVTTPNFRGFAELPFRI